MSEEQVAEAYWAIKMVDLKIGLVCVAVVVAVASAMLGARLLADRYGSRGYQPRRRFRSRFGKRKVTQ